MENIKNKTLTKISTSSSREGLLLLVSKHCTEHAGNIQVWTDKSARKKPRQYT